mmetsp:Transcript_35833/g.26619  ORF Transcript_35833/g.26619 Transcript_35833/m.26619 type:complete len:137 (+) Transcript_35833:116-526(+)
MDHFAKKDVLCEILARLEKMFPDQYNFIPTSFMLPDDFELLKQYMKAFPSQTFIAKPSKGKGGKGIFLVKKFADLHKISHLEDFILQKYIENPLLVNGKKFDLRVYLVLKSIQPLKVFICQEGLARFCTVNYKRPD